MSGFKPYARREPGTLHEALGRAIDQLGGVNVAADIIDRSPGWLTDAANPNREKNKQGKVNLSEAAAMSRAGATALAEYFAHLCRGVFLPAPPVEAPGALQIALAAMVRDSGNAVSELIQRGIDGEIDVPDARAGIERIDDAVRAFMSARLMLEGVIETGKSLT